MRSLHPRGTPSDEHAEAVSRRLATLTAELAAVRGDLPVGHRHTQVRSPYAAAPADDNEAVEPVEVFAVPIPGRHSARGPLGGALGPLSSRLRLAGAHVAVIAVVIAGGVAVAAWLAVRSDPEPVPALAPVSEPLVNLPESASSSSSTAPGIGPGTGASTWPSTGPGSSSAQSSGVASPGMAAGMAAGPAGDVTVDVAGKVRQAGIAVLPAGSRVVDALEAAGGARRGVDLASLNLARPLIDGEQILVGLPVPAGVVGSLGTAPGPADPGPLVNLNTADLAGLETLPGVGPVTADAIVSWRTDHGGFTAVEELLEVDGIGDATLAEIAPHVTI